MALFNSSATPADVQRRIARHVIGPANVLLPLPLISAAPSFSTTFLFSTFVLFHNSSVALVNTVSVLRRIAQRGHLRLHAQCPVAHVNVPQRRVHRHARQGDEVRARLGQLIGMAARAQRRPGVGGRRRADVPALRPAEDGVSGQRHVLEGILLVGCRC